MAVSCVSPLIVAIHSNASAAAWRSKIRRARIRASSGRTIRDGGLAPCRAFNQLSKNRIRRLRCVKNAQNVTVLIFSIRPDFKERASRNFVSEFPLDFRAGGLKSGEAIDDGNRVNARAPCEMWLRRKREKPMRAMKAIIAGFIVSASPGATAYAAALVSPANLHKGPGERWAVIARIPAGAIIDFVDCGPGWSNNWRHVKYNC